MYTSESLAKTIFQQIACGHGVDGSIGLSCLQSWGASTFRWRDPTDTYLAALLFQVQGHLHQGFVQVELTYADTYTVRLVAEPDQPTLNVVEDVYFDTLCETIDRLVEHNGGDALYARRCQDTPFTQALRNAGVLS